MSLPNFIKNFEEYIILSHEIGWNLRKWLKYYLPTLNYSTLQKLVRKKDILINREKCNLNSILKPNTKIQIYKNLQQENLEQKNKLREKKFNEMIIFEDENIIAINKPQGISSQGGKSVRISLADFCNLFIVHRLDKETTGIMLLAKNKQTASLLAKMFKERKIKKTYEAICYKTYYTEGIFQESGIWRENFEAKDGKILEAITEFEKIEESSNFCILRLKPLTGRKHQIRKQCTSHGLPIFGDILYGGPKAKRLYLHSTTISFEHPYSKKKITISRPSNFSLKILENL